MVLLGGIKRIGSVTEKLVPFMALFYVVMALGVVVLNIPHLPAGLCFYYRRSFLSKAFTGGLVGSMFREP
ncbi:MAG: alanine:cation symporter family protein [Blautia sp.]